MRHFLFQHQFQNLYGDYVVLEVDQRHAVLDDHVVHDDRRPYEHVIQAVRVIGTVPVEDIVALPRLEYNGVQMVEIFDGQSPDDAVQRAREFPETLDQAVDHVKSLREEERKKKL